MSEEERRSKRRLYGGKGPEQVVRAAVMQTLWQLRYGKDDGERGTVADEIVKEALAAKDNVPDAVGVAIAAAFSLSDDAGHGDRRQAGMSGRYDGGF